jgi:hypothetical protein
MADDLGEKTFRLRYKNNLVDWLNADEVFPKLKELGINAVKIPIPEDIMLPLD